MSAADPARVAAILAETAQEAVLPRFRHLTPGDIHEKTGPADLVTVADTEAERMLSVRLTDLLPGSAAVGEEAVAAHPELIERLSGANPVWVIDPVDGTALFAKGEAGFTMIVALVREGRTRMGWIHEPLAARTAIATEGEGAWMGGRPLRASADRPIAELVGAPLWRKGRILEGAVRRLDYRGSAGGAYLDLAEAKLDFLVARRLNPWDHAAGVLIHGEAGGYGRLFDGKPYRPLPTLTGLLLAPGPRSWAELRARFDP